MAQLDGDVGHCDETFEVLCKMPLDPRTTSSEIENVESAPCLVYSNSTAPDD